MGLLDKISKYIPVYRRCPAGRLHRVTANNPECGCTGKVLDWCEEYQRWIPNPTKTTVAKDMADNDEEFSVERDARQRVEEALKSGDLKPVEDFKRSLMRK